MFQILDTATLLQLLDAPSEAVFHTIETGLWSGCVWPDHPEWELHEPCAQVRSLALHYFTVRHPTTEVHRYETVAQILASQACPQGGAGHLEAESVHQGLLWLWALAGGPSPSEIAAVPCPSPSPVPERSPCRVAILSPLPPHRWHCLRRCYLLERARPGRSRRPSYGVTAMSCPTVP